MSSRRQQEGCDDDGAYKVGYIRVNRLKIKEK